MDSERWLKVEQLYHAALERQRELRAGWVKQATAGDEALQNEVLSLLAESEDGEGFLEEPAMHVAAQVLAKSSEPGGVATAPGSHPAVIGRYRILGILGEGGMGTVYEAEQEEPRRIVALKVTRPGLATPERLRRFRHESQALGRLQHPGIAQIYEAGAADTGFGPQPYFAMELIRGLPLDRYVGTHALNLRQKLALMSRICDAIHHAHQRGLIHRDLKPGNILVDDSGQPKILDFGIARLTAEEAPLTFQTEVGQIVGTLAYMSPEQVRGDPNQVDTRSDVYSLGVILFELLTGRLPYNISGRQVHEAAQTILETEPESLSSISRAYRGDLETIVGKTLEKDKTRRYESAAAMAADLENYLNDQPIFARPPSATYQLRKFARRHLALVAGAAAVFVVLVAGVAVSATLAVRARLAEQAALAQRDRATAAEQTATQQRNLAQQAQQAAVREQNRALAETLRADEQAATATAESSFLENDLLSQAGSRGQIKAGTKPDPDMKVRTLLDRAAARIEGKFDGQPLVEASLRLTIGMAYRELGEYSKAQHHVERAIELRRKSLGDQSPDTLIALRDLATVYERQGKYKDAEELYGKVLEAQRRILGATNAQTTETTYALGSAEDEDGNTGRAEDMLSRLLASQQHELGGESADTLRTASRLAGVYRSDNKLPQAEALITRTLESQKRVLGEDHPDTLLSMQTLALVYWNETKYAQAEPLLSKALEVQRRDLGEENRDTIGGMKNLALLYLAEGKFPQAESLMTRELEIERRILGEEHRDTVGTMQDLAVVYRQDSKYKEAEPLAEKTVEIRRRQQGEENPDTLGSMNNLACLYLFEGRYGEAEPLYKRILEIRRRKWGDTDPDTLMIMSNLASLYTTQGRYQEAEPLSTQAFEGRHRTLGDNSLDTLTSMYALGQIYRLEKKYQAAETILTKATEGDRRILGAEHPTTMDVMGELASLFEDQGRLGESDALFSTILETRRRALGPDHPDTLDAMTSLAEVRIKEKKQAEAEPLLREALAQYKKTDPESWEFADTQSLLGESLAAQQKFDEAELLLEAGYEKLNASLASLPFEERERIGEVGQNLVALYEGWGKPDKAAEWREKLRTR